MKPVYYVFSALSLAAIGLNHWQAADDPRDDPIKYRAVLMSTASTGGLTVGGEVQLTIIGAPVRLEPPEEQKITYPA